jgi:hypothetical protein
MALINKQLILPWIKRHKCKQQPFGPHAADNPVVSNSNSATYCTFCEDYVLWFTFAKEILTFSKFISLDLILSPLSFSLVSLYPFSPCPVTPKQEIEIPEVNFHSLFEIISMKETIRNVRSNLPTEEQTINIFGGALTIELSNMSLENKAEDMSPSAEPKTVPETTKLSNHEEAVSEPAATKATANPAPLAPRRTNPEAGIWVTSSGIYYFKLTQLSIQHQLFYSLLKELYRVSDIDAFYHLLISLKLLVIHADVLELAAKEQKGFLIFTLEKMLVPK